MSSTFTATIPPIDKNPFIDTTSLPEGTLFIIFGAILLGLALVVAAWRLFVILSARAAAKNSESQFIALEPSYGGPFIDPVVSPGVSTPLAGPDTQASASSARKSRKARQKERESQIMQAQRFFSPTVEVMTHGNLGNQPMVASTTYLPAGYYSSTQGSSGDRMSYAPSLRPPSMRPQSMATGAPRPSSVAMTMSEVAHPNSGASISAAGGSAPAPRRKLRPPSQYLDDLIEHGA